MDVIDIVARQAPSTAPTTSRTTATTSSSSSSTSSTFVSPTTSSTLSSSATPTTEKPFFPDPTNLPTPTPTQTPEQQQQQARRNGTAKSILEFLFLAFAFLLILSMLIRRAIRLRNEGVPFSQFFRRSRNRRRRQSMAENSRERVRFPRTTGLPVHGLGAPVLPYHHLAELPTAYTPDGGDRYAPHLFEPSRARRIRTRASDIDARGRRVDHGERDWDADDDVELPPYDKHGGPPVYVDVLGVRAMQSVQMGEASPATSSEESRRTPEEPAIPPALHHGLVTLIPIPNTQPPRYSAAGEIAGERDSS